MLHIITCITIPFVNVIINFFIAQKQEYNTTCATVCAYHRPTYMYRIAGNFRGGKLSRIGRKGAFCGENFRGMLLMA